MPYLITVIIIMDLEKLARKQTSKKLKIVADTWGRGLFPGLGYTMAAIGMPMALGAAAAGGLIGICSKHHARVKFYGESRSEQCARVTLCKGQPTTWLIL